MTERGPDYTLEELVRAATLRAQKLPWKVIAERLGRDPKSLQVVSSRWRRGNLNTAYRAQKKTRVQRMIELAERGVKPKAIAQAVGLSTANVCMTLARRGIDGEMRRLYRETPVATHDRRSA